MEFDLLHPNSLELIVSRNDLLQRTMRPQPALFSILKEYPIVLDNARNEFSLCFSKDNRVYAHANLWPRSVISSTGQKITTIGLVGNVATDPQYQGQGIMTKLMERLLQIATDQGLSHLLLWSDLSSFYQKRGFTSLGREERLFIERQAIEPFVDKSRFAVIDPNSCRDKDLLQFLEERPKTALTLERTPEEFRQQLSIPGTHLIFDTQSCRSFAVLGKGYDMGGIIHEWGMHAKEGFLPLVAWTCWQFNLPEIGILIPGDIAPRWNEELSKFAHKKEQWPMALCKTLKDAKVDLSQLFVWGLDAI